MTLAVVSNLRKLQNVWIGIDEVTLRFQNLLHCSDRAFGCLKNRPLAAGRTNWHIPLIIVIITLPSRLSCPPQSYVVRYSCSCTLQWKDVRNSSIWLLVPCTCQSVESEDLIESIEWLFQKTLQKAVLYSYLSKKNSSCTHGTWACAWGTVYI